jgi:hypothetical protein
MDEPARRTERPFLPWVKFYVQNPLGGGLPGFLMTLAAAACGAGAFWLVREIMPAGRFPKFVFALPALGGGLGGFYGVGLLLYTIGARGNEAAKYQAEDEAPE